MLCLPSVRFKENVSTKKFISAEVIEYFLQPFDWKRTPQQSIQRCFPTFSKSFETKQIKKLPLPSELFQKNVYDELYFWENYRLLLQTLTQINSIVAVSREFSRSFETIIKNVSSFKNVSDGIISGKITGGCSVLLSFQKQPPNAFYEKGVLRNQKVSAQFTGKHLCQSIFFNKAAGRRLQIY